MSKFIWMALAVCGVLAIGVSVSWATGLTSLGFVGSDGSITSCVSNSNGSVRFIDPSSPNKNLNSCKNTETQVAVASPPSPASVTVDCSAGQSIQAALKQTLAAPSVDITVNGTCNESVKINRSNVTLEAGSPGAGIQAPSGSGALGVGDALNVSVQGLTLNGDFNAGGNSAVVLNDVTSQGGVREAYGASITVQGGSITGGVGAFDGGDVSLRGVTVTSPGEGVGATDGGSVEVNNSTISNSGGYGVDADGGRVILTAGTLITGSANSGVAAQDGGSVDFHAGVDVSGNHGGGVSARNGGHVTIRGGDTIENNTGIGVSLSGASSLETQTGPITIVRGNSGDGIHLKDTSVAQFGGTNQITGNGGWGIFCDSSPSVAVIEGNPGTVSGNTGGTNNCPSA